MMMMMMMQVMSEHLDPNTQEMMMNEYPADCLPVRCYIQFPFLLGDNESPFWQGWANLRLVEL